MTFLSPGDPGPFFQDAHYLFDRGAVCFTTFLIVGHFFDFWRGVLNSGGFTPFKSLARLNHYDLIRRARLNHYWRFFFIILEVIQSWWWVLGSCGLRSKMRKERLTTDFSSLSHASVVFFFWVHFSSSLVQPFSSSNESKINGLSIPLLSFFSLSIILLSCKGSLGHPQDIGC